MEPPSPPVSPAERLLQAGVALSAQRLVVAEYVLRTADHPSADEVWERVKRRMPVLSRATVYNTLGLFTRKGLLRELVLAEGKTVYDPKIEPHHHFIDEDTGAITDVPWSAVKVTRLSAPPGVHVREWQVVMRGSAGRRGKAMLARRPPRKTSRKRTFP